MDLTLLRTEQGTEVVTRTRQAFQRIGDSVQDISGRVEQIAAAQELAGSAEELTRLVARFKVAT